METEGIKASWESFFSDLENAEELLSKPITILSKSCELGKYIKTSYNADEWRSLHNQLSKNGKTIEKVNNVGACRFLFYQLYPGYNFENDSISEDNSDILWMEAIIETLVREGFTFRSQFHEETRSHESSYSKLSNFVGNFETNTFEIFQ